LLAAGLGSRLKPITNKIPKCLVDVGQEKMIDRWITACLEADVHEIFVNVHYLADIVKNHLATTHYGPYITIVEEPTLLGTAGTIRKIADQVGDEDLLVVHVDNWTDLSLKDFFLDYELRCPAECGLGMVTFDTSDPSKCGMCEVGLDGVVRSFVEKPAAYAGSTANGAIYLFKPAVLNYISSNPKVNDISLDVLPNFVGKIFAYHHLGQFIDIGTMADLTRIRQQIVDEKHHCP